MPNSNNKGTSQQRSDVTTRMRAMMVNNSRRIDQSRRDQNHREKTAKFVIMINHNYHQDKNQNHP